MTLAIKRCGQLRHCFDARGIDQAVKDKIYKAAVVSLPTYGSEAWHLSEKAKASINGANARCLSRITGKTAHTEVSARSRTFDILKAIRKRKFEWIGHILRLNDDRLVKHAIKVQYVNGDYHNMLSDAPEASSFDKLVEMANDRELWSSIRNKTFGITHGEVTPPKSCELC